MSALHARVQTQRSGRWGGWHFFCQRPMGSISSSWGLQWCRFEGVSRKTLVFVPQVQEDNGNLRRRHRGYWYLRRRRRSRGYLRRRRLKIGVSAPLAPENRGIGAAGAEDIGICAAGTGDIGICAALEISKTCFQILPKKGFQGKDGNKVVQLSIVIGGQHDSCCVQHGS